MSTPTASDQWYIGVALILAASLFGGLGDNLVRCSHRKTVIGNGSRNGSTPLSRRDKHDETSTTLLLSLWIVGLLMTVLLNTIFAMWAMAYADSSLTWVRVR